MLDKGGFSFVALLVINPVVILFYQNCSMSPMSYAKSSAPPQAISRSVASQGSTTEIKIQKKDAQKKDAASKESIVK